MPLFHFASAERREPPNTKKPPVRPPLTGERNRPERSRRRRQIGTTLESTNTRLSVIRRAKERLRNYRPTCANQSNTAGSHA
jgi:hypothetical protein